MNAYEKKLAELRSSLISYLYYKHKQVGINEPKNRKASEKALEDIIINIFTSYIIKFLAQRKPDPFINSSDPEVKELNDKFLENLRNILKDLPLTSEEGKDIAYLICTVLASKKLKENFINQIIPKPDTWRNGNSVVSILHAQELLRSDVDKLLRHLPNENSSTNLIDGLRKVQNFDPQNLTDNNTISELSSDILGLAKQLQEINNLNSNKKRPSRLGQFLAVCTGFIGTAFLAVTNWLTRRWPSIGILFPFAATTQEEHSPQLQ